MLMWQQATGIFLSQVLVTFNSITETNEDMSNFTLQFDFSSSSTSEDINESTVNEENISQMPENRANNIYHIIKMSFSIISALIIVLSFYKRNIKRLISILYSLI